MKRFTQTVLTFTALTVSSVAGAQTLKVFQIDVDQGDSTLFVSPSGNTLLVDTGRNGHGDRIKAAMGSAGVTQIDHLVTTHYHEDHYGGADELVNENPVVTVVNVYDRGDKAFLEEGKTDKPRFKEYEESLGHRAVHLMRGETIALDPDMVVTCISSGSVVLGEAPVHHGERENDMSISLLIQYGDFRYFVGGDIEDHTEEKISSLDLVTDVDVYQADHHGSDTSSSVGFIEDLAPTLIVISNGNRADYRHPKQETLDNYEALSPTPTVIQLNEYTKGGDGGNVALELIADPVPNGSDGTVTITVDGDGSYVAEYRGKTRSFQSKPRVDLLAPAIQIVSLLPDPAGSDRDLEQATVKNNHGSPVDMTGWLIRDAAGRVWSLASLGTIVDGDRATVIRAGMAMSLDNDGDTIQLITPAGSVAHEVSYPAVSVGQEVEF